MLHKTDGLNANRPFFHSMQDVRKSIFSQIDHLSRYVFCFFSSRKEIVLLSFLSRKKRKQKKVICGTGILYTPAVFPNVQHKTDGSNANRPFFHSMQDACESIFSQLNQL
jgi:hypothetical protein